MNKGKLALLYAKFLKQSNKNKGIIDLKTFAVANGITTTVLLKEVLPCAQIYGEICESLPLFDNNVINFAQTYQYSVKDAQLLLDVYKQQLSF